jgi:hypothetical protein
MSDVYLIWIGLIALFLLLTVTVVALKALSVRPRR